MQSLIVSAIVGVAIANTTSLMNSIYNRDDSGDGKRNFAEICAENGFAYEEHRVQTEDGYILTQFRIPGKVGESPSNKPPVFF